MAKSRLLMHPVLLQKRSRLILLWTFLAVVAVSALLYWRLHLIVTEAGVSTNMFTSDNSSPVLLFLLSPLVRVALVLFSVLIGSGITSIAILGPFKRIEEWLVDWEVGYDLSPLNVRSGDKYGNLIRLINELHDKAAHKKHDHR